MFQVEQRRRLTAGAILIVLGIGLLAINLVESLSDSSALFLIGSIFIIAYFVRRSYGLLIPGSILIGLGLGAVGETAFGFEGLGGIGLGIGFIMIFVIDLIYTGQTHWWPLIPGGILVVTGLASTSETMQRLLEVGWPLILVAIGLVVLAGAFGLTGRQTQ